VPADAGLAGAGVAVDASGVPSHSIKEDPGCYIPPLRHLDHRPALGQNRQDRLVPLLQHAELGNPGALLTFTYTGN